MGEPAWKALARRLEQLVPGDTDEEISSSVERLSAEERAEAARLATEIRSLRFAWPN